MIYTLLFSLYILMCVFIYVVTVIFKSKMRGGKTKNVLFVIAHPDDECMFFSPTVLSHIHNKTNVSILSLSNGNFYGKGAVREKELVKSCAIFGVPRENAIIINDEKLQEGPGVFWNASIAGEEVLKILRGKHYEKIITFDGKGVSGHRNHISAYKTVRYLVRKQALPEGTSAYCLETVKIVRKYSSFLDLPFSILGCIVSGKQLYVSSPCDVWRAQKAMAAHWSQFVWYRILFIIFSRYMIINTLITITKSSPPGER